jgi:hypothetical protein
VSEDARRSRGAVLEKWLPWTAGTIVGALALLAITAVPVGVFWDDGVYLIGAKSLATGAGYRFLHLPGAPPAVHFPPAWPALLSLVWRLYPSFPDNVWLLKLVNPLLLGAGAALVSAYGARRLRVPPLAAAVAAVVFATALPLIVIAGVLFSEPFFFVILMIALALADRAADEGGWRLALAAGAAAGLLALVRSAGLPLVPALVIALLVARRRGEAAVAAGGALALLAPWQVWIAMHANALAVPLRGSYGPYVEWVLGLYRERGAAFTLVIARMNVLGIVQSLGIALFPFGPRAIRPLLVTLVLVVAAVAVVRARRRAMTALLFLAFYFALVLLWPYSPGRFLWAVWPLTGMLLASGAVECWRIGAARGAVMSVRATSALACAIGVFAIAGHAGYSVRGASRHWWDNAARANADQLIPVAAWIEEHTKPDDVIAVVGEPFIYLHTGRTVVPVHILSPDEYVAGTPVELEAANLRKLVIAGRPNYAVFSGTAVERLAAPLLDGKNGTPRFDLIGAVPGGGVAYRVVLPP